MYPLVIAAKSLTQWLSPSSDAPSVSREDFHALAKMGHREGVLDAKEAQAIAALVAFRGLTVKDVMTPRPVVASLAGSLRASEVLDEYPNLKFSRIPIFDSSGDDIVGFVRKDDIYKAVAQGSPDTPLTNLKRNLLSVLETKSLPELMQQMVDRRYSMALVINEYGDPLGIATMEDLVETMIGMEIVDESDTHVDMQERARDLWKQRAKAAGLLDEADRG